MSGASSACLFSVHCNDGWDVDEVGMNQEYLSEVSWVKLIKEYSVMMLTTSISSSTRMLSVLPNTTMSSRYVSPLLPILPQSWSAHVLP